MEQATETITEADTEFENLTMEFLAFQYAAHPVMATRKGVHDYDDSLDAFQRFAIRDDRDQVRAYLHAIDKISLADLCLQNRVDYRLARSSAQMTLSAMEHQRWPETRPDYYLDTVLAGLTSLVSREYDAVDIRAIGLLGRLLAVPAALTEAKNNLQKPPRLFLEAAAERAETSDALFSETLPAFYLIVKDRPLRNALKNAETPARAAFAEYARFLREMPSAPNDDFTLGKERYDYSLRIGHFMPETSDDVLEICRDEIVRSQRELAEVAERVEPGAHWAEQVSRLRKSHPKMRDLHAAYQEETQRARAFLEFHRLMTLPEQEELRVLPTPAWAKAQIPHSGYLPAAPFEERQEGTLWVTPITPGMGPELRELALREHSRYLIPVVALHEGYPGRHQQISRANQTASRFRRHFAESELFIEGWAVYCEEMMWEHGFFSDPRIRLMQVLGRLRRACLARLDVEIHTQGKALDEAAPFLQETLQMAPDAAAQEIRRCALNPVAAMAPVMGRRALFSLRGEVMRRQGARFMARRFHDQILAEGSLPPVLLREILFAVR